MSRDKQSGYITGNVIGTVRELRTPDGDTVLAFSLEGTKKTTAMHGGNYQFIKYAKTFMCIVRPDSLTRALTNNARISVEADTLDTANHLPEASGLPPTIEFVTTIFAFAAN